MTFRAPVAADDLADFLPAVRSLVTSAPEKVIFCSDFRELKTIPPRLRDPLVWLLRGDNEKIACNGILIAPDNLALMGTLASMMDEASAASRRVFSDTPALKEWLAPHLTAEELSALDSFLTSTPTG